MNTKLRDHIVSNIDMIFVEADGAIANCLNCSNFDEKAELCKKYNQRPPARIIALACPEHEDVNGIPY